MKHLSTALLAVLLLTACETNGELAVEETLAQDEESEEARQTFEEKAAQDQELAETRQAMFEAQNEADQVKFAQMEPTDDDGDGYKTFSAEEYGVVFDFPADWNFELDRYGDGYRVDLNSGEPTDGCVEGQLGLAFAFPNMKDETISFSDYIHNSGIYDQDGGMGVLGGTLTPLTVAAHEAFHAENSGYETIGCLKNEAYVVEMNSTSYLFIGVFAHEVDAEAVELKKILDSLSFN